MKGVEPAVFSFAPRAKHLSWKKKLARNYFRAVQWISRFLPHLSTCDSDGGDGGDGSNDGRRTNSKAGSSHSTDTAGNNGTGNSSHMGNIHSTPDRPRFRLRCQRQTAARE